MTAPVSASAHGFGRLYNLPVPLWLYAWGAGAALALSFVVIGFFAAQGRASAVPRGLPSVAGAGDGRDAGGRATQGAVAESAGAAAVSPASAPASAERSAAEPARASPVWGTLGVCLLVLTIATGFFGNRDPYRNFSMTFFWVVFVLGFTYLTALFGDFWARSNPWRAIAEALGRFGRGYKNGRVRYDALLGGRLGDWPAVALYLGFIWFELFNHGRPSTLAAILLAYTALNLAGVWLVGASAWFRHCEFFSVLFRLVALMAPHRDVPVPSHGDSLRSRAAQATAGMPEVGQRREQLPNAQERPPRTGGLSRERPERLSTVVFALALLSTTAFDGLRATQWWVGLIWNDPTGIVTSLAGQRPILVYPTLLPWYFAWETVWLLASPFLYFGVYMAFIAMAKLVARSERSLRDLALDFGYTLLPIALVYNVTHYYTLILTQGLKIVSLLSDPFGWGWNLFGTAHLLRAPILPSMGLVWHTQVGLILAGHIASVYVAHLVALRVFPTRRQALLSQLPMLGLMVVFTVAGLWILAQPLTAMKMR